mgnify:CR=1 FL=1
MTPEQLEKWTEHPATQALLKLVTTEIKEIQDAMGGCYHPFQPERTQEILAGLNGRLESWEEFQPLLEGDWSKFDEEDDD